MAPKGARCSKKWADERLDWKANLGAPWEYDETKKREITKNIRETIRSYKLGAPINSFKYEWLHPVYGLFSRPSSPLFQSLPRGWMLVFENLSGVCLDHNLSFEFGVLSAPYGDGVKAKRTIAVYISSLLEQGVIVYAAPLDFKYHNDEVYPFVVTFKVVKLDDLLAEFGKRGTWNLDEALFKDVCPRFCCPETNLG